MGVTFGYFPFATTTTDSDTVYNITLFGFVPKSSGFVRSGRPGCSVNGVQLTVLPASHTEEETKEIRLLFFVQFFKIFVCSHLGTF